MAFMSIDRWLVIHKPFHYDTLMPSPKVYVVNALLCIDFEYYADIHICVMRDDDEALIAMVIASLSRLPSLFIITFFTVLTCRTAHNHARRIHAMEALRNDRMRSPSVAQSNKHIKTSLIIILTNTCTWLPLYLTQLLSVAVPSIQAPRGLIFFVTWLQSSSAYINWIICMLTDTNFYAATKLLFWEIRLCCCCHEDEEERRTHRHPSCSRSNPRTSDSQVSSVSDYSRY
ncbi:hypothetical protein CAPTEDRAFT_202962 [Capitella teleta]|uniref:G-protein coupled receptors family 1 profile domain-containing protein n=1 Tax=Capitella teleta TaxID=283909 RepID=R7VFC1_CAPTE|nr:hypothetical protein CAPTEDRAFT_202962 [Capitella teleta]|eukprot:ELU17548.1 hypothetical protein CAPTEDRAFT_202962 [Capitella teleta]